MQQNRARLWALGAAYSGKWEEHEILYDWWFRFYSSPIKEPDPDGMTAPQRETWFREQAVRWSAQIAPWEPHTQEPPLNSKVEIVVGVGLAIAAIAAIYGVSK
ncbi:MAG: hypothetical protein E6Q97_20390 [Desulfurellales bacterium]|nr:MAG: hypothetical protein E6Q97_20390 [Desulfurellales bacterium]